MSDIVKVLRDLCDNNYNDNFEKVLNDLLDYYDHDNTGVVKALDSINESISLEALDAMEAAIEEIKKLREDNRILSEENTRMKEHNRAILLCKQRLARGEKTMCVWRSNLTLKQSGLYHEVFWIRCDGSHVQAVATNTPCYVCGKPIKFA
jgi:DNA repair exonuclease SbcCD ATPase subunit